LWFETLCEDLLSPDFIETLQRALAARGFYSAQTTGVIDRNTRRAILAYQTSEDLHSDVLSLAAARRLGLSEIPRNE
jgi:spermidine synthase